MYFLGSDKEILEFGNRFLFCLIRIVVIAQLLKKWIILNKSYMLYAYPRPNSLRRFTESCRGLISGLFLIRPRLRVSVIPSQSALRPEAASPQRVFKKRLSY
jgi:hypothetical protein